jgi:hypothetical protein
MSNPEVRMESPANVPATTPPALHGEQFQANAAEMRDMRSLQKMPEQMPADNQLLAQLGMVCSTRTPAVMADVERSTAEANKIFPGKDQASQDLGDAVYRYIMNAEKVDDYSMGSAADIARLNQDNPKTIDTLNAYVRDQFAQGLVPANDLSQVEAKYPAQPWTGKIVLPQ